MATLVPARRVTVVTESSLERVLLDELSKIGVHGHTSAHVSGAGRHQLSEDLMPWNTAIRCEMVVSPGIADEVMDYLHGEQFKGHPLACWVDDTWIDSRDNF
jgi:nitrogen regulatory protein PII